MTVLSSTDCQILLTLEFSPCGEMNSDLHAPFGGLVRLSHTIEVLLQLRSECKLRLKHLDQFEWTGKMHISKILV
jgi:hypothetical protein